MDRSASGSRRIGGLAAGAGALLVVASTGYGGGFPREVLPFMLIALVPYALLLAGSWVVRDAWAMGGAAAAALALELGVRASVYVFPRGSTAAIALIFSPPFVAAAALLGGLAGSLLGRVWRVGTAPVRAGVAVLAATLLGLLVLGLARPELLPWAVLGRRAALARIGEPRIVAGDAAFESVVLSEAQAWHRVGELDGEPGDEIAVVDHRGASLFDPVTLGARGRVEFGGEPGRLWNWYSTLARLGGRLVVVQTGGGYSEAELRELDGGLVWRLPLEAELPPRALRPADLDGDGELELYAAELHALVRVDPAGRVVWRRPMRLSEGLLLRDRPGAGAPAFAALLEAQGHVAAFDAAGDPVADLRLPEGRAPVAVVERPEGPAFALGDSRLLGIGLRGEPRFDVPLGEDFALRSAVSVRFRPEGPAWLAASAMAPRDVPRARLLLLAPDLTVAYDEILTGAPELLVAERPDGAQTLLASGSVLRVLRPRR